MKAKPLKQTPTGYVECDAREATHVMLNMPGPIPTRIIPVMINGMRRGTGNWTWNGDTEKPTLRPSILTRGGDGDHRCHSWVNDGMVQFLHDCSHDLADRTLPLLEID